MTGGAAFGAMIGVGADEQPPTAVVGNNFVQVGIRRPAQPARMWCVDGAETGDPRSRATLRVSRAGLRRCAFSRPAPNSCSAGIMSIFGLSNAGIGLGDIR